VIRDVLREPRKNGSLLIQISSAPFSLCYIRSRIPMSAKIHGLVVLVVLLLAAPVRLFAGVALLVGEPFGKFGHFNPTGHAAIYLSNICAETPITLRLCRPGEDGTVISRYDRIGGFDWIAVPLIPYLYAVERAADVPATADEVVKAQLRETYRSAQLKELVAQGAQGGDWIQLIGSAYDRKIYGYALDTTPEDDERLVRRLNSRENSRRFNLFWRNCADFAREILNFYYPGAVGRNFIGDFGIMTPKHAAKALIRYSQRHPEGSVRHFVVPQIPGGRSSSKLRGVNESLIRSKKYVVPLVVLQPWVAASAAVAYLSFGRFNPGRHITTACEAAKVAACMVGGEIEAQERGQRAAYTNGNATLPGESLSHAPHTPEQSGPNPATP
jgi:hypothetical protein